MRGVGLGTMLPYPNNLPCKLVDPEIFFDHEQEEEAKRVCKACPIAADCRNGARARAEEYGVWGGETPSERHIAIHGRARLYFRELPAGDLTDDQKERVMDLREEGYGLGQIAQICKLSYAQVHNLVQRVRRKEAKSSIHCA